MEELSMGDSKAALYFYEVSISNNAQGICCAIRNLFYFFHRKDMEWNPTIRKSIKFFDNGNFAARGTNVRLQSL